MKLRYKKLIIIFTVAIMFIGLGTFSLIAPSMPLTFGKENKDKKDVEKEENSNTVVDEMSEGEVKSRISLLITNYLDAKQRVDMEEIAECVTDASHIDNKRLVAEAEYIENYKTTLRNLAKFGVKVVTYNFMPIFDWTRTDLFHPMEDGSTALFYEKSRIHEDYKEMAEYILSNLHGMTFPGWEPERMAQLDALFEKYKPVTKEKLWENLKYFLEALMPTCHETGIKLAIHQDDPPWDIFGLPRLLVDKESIGRFLSIVDDEYNCLCLCSGSLGANPENNVADIIRTYCDRIAFAHIRNVKHFPNGDFTEASHRDCDGDVGILEIMRAYHDCGYKGYVRPDHGRHIWGEQCRPGYGLYDRALGIMYLWGCWDMLERTEGKVDG